MERVTSLITRFIAKLAIQEPHVIWAALGVASVFLLQWQNISSLSDKIQNPKNDPLILICVIALVFLVLILILLLSSRMNLKQLSQYLDC
jgi:amino acid transporter